VYVNRPCFAQEGATSLKYAFWCRNVKLTIAIIVIVLVVAFFVVVGACGGFQFPSAGARLARLAPRPRRLRHLLQQDQQRRNLFEQKREDFFYLSDLLSLNFFFTLF
jgi:hypothetical protein